MVRTVVGRMTEGHQEEASRRPILRGTFRFLRINRDRGPIGWFVMVLSGCSDEVWVSWESRDRFRDARGTGRKLMGNPVKSEMMYSGAVPPLSVFSLRRKNEPDHQPEIHDKSEPADFRFSFWK